MNSCPSKICSSVTGQINSNVPVRKSKIYFCFSHCKVVVLQENGPTSSDNKLFLGYSYNHRGRTLYKNLFEKAERIF